MKIKVGKLKQLIREARKLSDLDAREREEFLEAFEDYGTTFWNASPEMKQQIARLFDIEI